MKNFLKRLFGHDELGEMFQAIINGYKPTDEDCKRMEYLASLEK